MPTFYYLPSCKTCQRVLAAVQPLRDDWTLRNIKAEPLTGDELDHLARLAGGYAPLFSRRARLYRERGLKDQDLTEADYRRLILEHYTFLSRPVVEVDGRVFVGSGKKAVEGAVAKLAAGT